MMKTEFENYSTYTNPEDIKRLVFVVHSVMENVAPDGKILDMGCGKGNMAIQLARMGYFVTGIDKDKLSIEYAESRITLPNLTFQIMCVEDFQGEEHSVDVIICSEILEHLVDPQSFLIKIIRLLNENGILIITVPNGYGPRELFVTRPFIYLTSHFTIFLKGFKVLKKIMGYHGSDQSNAENLEHLHFFTFNQVKKMARQFDFEIIKRGKSNFIENTFPISFITNRVPVLKVWDTQFADLLPYRMVSGFFTVWKKTTQTRQK